MPGDPEFLEKDGAAGFSTFMAYYILTAYNISGGKNAISLIKQYFGGMLMKGATTFWEDFDIQWLNNSFGIDEFPRDNTLDIHGDFGKYCYKGFRHSLCHGWSCSVVSFVIESIFGIKIEDGWKRVSLKPTDVDFDYSVKFPTPYGTLCIEKNRSGLQICAPEGVNIIKGDIV